VSLPKLDVAASSPSQELRKRRLRLCWGAFDARARGILRPGCDPAWQPCSRVGEARKAARTD